MLTRSLRSIFFFQNNRISGLVTCLTESVRRKRMQRCFPSSPILRLAFIQPSCCLVQCPESLCQCLMETQACLWNSHPGIFNSPCPTEATRCLFATPLLAPRCWEAGELLWLFGQRPAPGPSQLPLWWKPSVSVSPPSLLCHYFWKALARIIQNISLKLLFSPLAKFLIEPAFSNSLLRFF